MICEPPTDRKNLRKPTTFPANKHYIGRSRRAALWRSAVSQKVTNENEDLRAISLQTLLTYHRTLSAEITMRLKNNEQTAYIHLTELAHQCKT